MRERLCQVSITAEFILQCAAHPGLGFIQFDF